MNTPQPPAPPQASQITQASQIANNTNQITPGGNLTYTQGPNGQWTANTALTGGAAGVYNNNMTAAANQTPQDIGNAVQNDVSLAQKYMQPVFNQQNSALQSQLQNQGFSQGDVAAQLANRNLQNNQNDWIGGQLPAFNQMALNNYNAPIQAANAVSKPNFVQTPQVDVNGAYNTQAQGQQYNYGQQMQNNSAMMGGLFSIPSAALGGWARNGFSLGGAAASGGANGGIASALGLGSGISDADLLASLALVA